MNVGRHIFLFHNVLDGGSRILCSLTHTSPSFRILRMSESSFSDRRSGIWNTFEDLQIAFGITLQPALFYLYFCILEI